MPMQEKQIALTEAEIWDILNIFKSYRKNMEHELSEVQEACKEQDCIMCKRVAEIEEQIALENALSEKFAKMLR